MIEQTQNFSRLDSAFANFLVDRATVSFAHKNQLKTLLAMLSQQQRDGHSCLEISDADKSLLLTSGISIEASDKDVLKYPIIIENNHCYLQRYWRYENRLAQQIKQFSALSQTISNIDEYLDRYFDNSSNNYLQRAAAKLAAENAFCIITGGPGTGKTTTICKIIALLQELSQQPLAIALSTPTGKATMRLQEAIVANLAQLNCPDAVKAKLPITAVTIHRLLGAKPPLPYFHHDATNNLIHDVVVVDEASMVDLALMGKLVGALKPTAKLILLGDKDQLSSVESGSVLSDLIAGLPNHTIELKQSYRFDNQIQQLADAVNQRDSESAWAILKSDQENFKLIEQDQLIATITQKKQTFLKLIKENASFTDIYQAYNKTQVLCANRHGKLGSLELNRSIERTLFSNKILTVKQPWYPGRPVMVLQNNPALQLYNGDIGICLPDQEMGGNLMVFFQRPDGTIKKYLPTRLPECETAFTMTIHKSQGSEYDEVVIVLPESINPVLCKELLYTAITRAKKQVKLVATKIVFDYTVQQHAIRTTGLSQKLLA